MIEFALKQKLETHVLIRPRPGGFVYNSDEIEIINTNINLCKELGVNGIVIGILDQKKQINEEIVDLILRNSKDMEVTFHRAFDDTPCFRRSLDILINIGVTRVLSSGLELNVDSGFNNYLDLNFIEAWIVSLSFTFQLYFDFSGYIDMATGSAILFNIRLPQNFDSPFKATSLINFWHRWHITLFKFLMNYIYFPWIRSLKKITYTKAMFVTFCVFIISGIWHGPTWGYVMFGVLHGIGLIINHTFNRLNLFKLHFLFGWFLTMFWVNLTQIFFRSKDLDTAIYISKTIFGLNGLNFYTNMFNNYFTILSTIAALIIVFCFKNTNYLIENHFKKSETKI